MLGANVGEVFGDLLVPPRARPRRVVAVEPVIHLFEVSEARLGLEPQHLVHDLFHELGRDVAEVVFRKFRHSFDTPSVNGK